MQREYSMAIDSACTVVVSYVHDNAHTEAVVCHVDDSTYIVVVCYVDGGVHCGGGWCVTTSDSMNKSGCLT